MLAGANNMRVGSIACSAALFGLWGAIAVSLLSPVRASEPKPGIASSLVVGAAASSTGDFSSVEGLPEAGSSGGEQRAPGQAGADPQKARKAGGGQSDTDDESLTPAQRYGPLDTRNWHRDALRSDTSPVDVSFLNAKDRPAGIHGFVKVDGEHFKYEDGTQARFWGANLAASALFATPRPEIERQARRMAQLGYNLMRIVHHDSDWYRPNIFVDNGKHDTRRLAAGPLDQLDWWIKCLKDEGIYIWMDMCYARVFTPADGVKLGFQEIARQKANVFGFSYFNEEVREAMVDFQHQLLDHANRYTKLKYKDDPSIVGVLITNENDLTAHFGNICQADHNNPIHRELFKADLEAFAKESGLPEADLWRTWLPGSSKIFLNAMEHRFNSAMISDLRGLGVRVPLVTTNMWGGNPLFSLPSLTDAEIVDAHSYGGPEELSKNPRTEANFVAWLAAARVQGKPLSITEWNIPTQYVDRFTMPMYVASIAALQGWDMPMIYCYSQMSLKRPDRTAIADPFSTFNDPRVTGVMPAAAVAFRRGHISPARTNICLMLSRDQLFNQSLTPQTAAALRTIFEQNRFSIGLPAIKELPWLKPTEPPAGVTIVNDPQRDFIPEGKSSVRSDTGELMRSWKYGVQVVDSARTQSVSGWIGGKLLKTADALFHFTTKKATVILTSIDDKPLATSGAIMITAMGRAVPTNKNELPYFSEPIVGTITLKTKTAGLELLSLSSSGSVLERITPEPGADGLSVHLPSKRGTHWYVLKATEPAPKQAAP
jgi:hypothetical protein